MNEKEFNRLLITREQPPQASALEDRIIQQTQNLKQYTGPDDGANDIAEFPGTKKSRWIPAAMAASLMLAAVVGLNMLDNYHADRDRESLVTQSSTTITDFEDALIYEEELLLENFYES